jgi:hypothetical protein
MYTNKGSGSLLDPGSGEKYNFNLKKNIFYL